jgi:hypothetical protein
LWIVVFVVGGLGAQFFDTLARFTGSEFLHSVSVAWIAGSFAGWATGFVCVGVTGIGITALPILFNVILRRRLGMHRPPKVHKLPSGRGHLLLHLGCPEEPSFCRSRSDHTCRRH